MFNSMRHVFAAALMYLGLDPNSNNIEDLKKARDVINKASAYWVKFDSDSYYRGLLRGDIWVSQAYSNDIFKTILDAKNSNSPIKIAGMLQKEGNMYELDNIVIPINQNNNSSKASAKSNLAMQNIYKFINNSLDKQSEYELSLATGSSIMNTQALKILKANKPDIINTDWIYPQDMQKMHTFTAYDPKIRILANSLWTEIQMQCNYVN